MKTGSSSKRFRQVFNEFLWGLLGFIVFAAAVAAFAMHEGRSPCVLHSGPPLAIFAAVLQYWVEN